MKGRRITPNACPRCWKGETVRLVHERECDVWYVECDYCGCRGLSYDNALVAMIAWNRRCCANGDKLEVKA